MAALVQSSDGVTEGITPEDISAAASAGHFDRVLMVREGELVDADAANGTLSSLTLSPGASHAWYGVDKSYEKNGAEPAATVASPETMKLGGTFKGFDHLVKSARTKKPKLVGLTLLNGRPTGVLVADEEIAVTAPDPETPFTDDVGTKDFPDDGQPFVTLAADRYVGGTPVVGPEDGLLAITAWRFDDRQPVEILIDEQRTPNAKLSWSKDGALETLVRLSLPFGSHRAAVRQTQEDGSTHEAFANFVVLHEEEEDEE